MVSLSYLLTALLCSLPFLLFLNKWRRSYSGKTPPPSPPKLPVLGNLHQLGTFPHRSLQSLSRRYGPVMQLHFGSVPVLVASSPEAAREIMKNQDLNFSNRPNLSIPRRLLYDNHDVAFAPYGEYWRQIRSICVLQLLSNKRVQSFRRVREEETSIMVEKIMQLQKTTPTAAVNLTDLLTCLTNDVFCRIALGKKYGGTTTGDGEYHVRSLKKNLAEFYVLLGISPLWEYIPWLEWTRRFDGVDRRIEEVSRTFDEFLGKVIQEHRVRDKREDTTVVGDTVGLDFVDLLLQFQRENERSSSPVDDLTIKAVILDMFLAGTDTTVTALEWALSELIKNPRAMKILQKEVRGVAGTGSKGEIEESDLEKMPYLKAVMKESLRLHAPVPLLVPRESTRDTKVLGYDIASGTRVLINSWAIGRDSSVWEESETFLPERFLETSIDYRGMHFELIPFGSGRRGCPGATFAAAIDELALATLVHKFDFKLPNGVRVEDLDMSEGSGFTIHKKFPLLVVPTPHACTS